MPRSHTVSDETLHALRIRATDRLRALDLPPTLLDDESGQTSALDHWTWLVDAPETEIREWVRDLDR